MVFLTIALSVCNASAEPICYTVGNASAELTCYSLQQRTTPGATWETRTPAQVGLDAAKLDQVRTYLGGRGFISRYGYQVYSWGDVAQRADIASAAKPIYAHFLFKAVEEGKLAGVDAKANAWETRLSGKDANITFRHFATQTSCYGVTETPGAAFDYNDWQMALFWDTLFLKVYAATLSDVDGTVLRPRLATPLGCQDAPTFLAFGANDRPGRVAISVRDHARFGLLYQRKGDWGGTRLLSQANSTTAVASPLPLSIPRTAGVAAPMLSGQRTIGSSTIPDNQTDHHGSYSWLWWVNGVRRDGRRFWPDAPTDVYASLGHANGKRGVAVMPSQEIVIAWNDTTLDQKPADPHPLNEVFKLLAQAVQVAPDPIVADGPWLRYANGPHVFMAGPGDPEGFLYRTDQATLINKMKGTGANCI
ncbi:MAG TPA: hypothetical protein VEJ18_05980, partial [Planctomycetota bacterium]|nr:hypothetical protein [Planctomycetota bacterium]